VFDGGHNPEAIKNLIENLNFFYPGRKKVFILNFMKDKEYGKNLDIILPAADEILVKKIHNARAVSPVTLLSAVKKRKNTCPIRAVGCLSKSVLNSLPSDALIVCCGSFYLLGEIERELQYEGCKISWR
jgi:dihydrofolate synthase/folylpolyglutamate synthase